MIARRQRAQTIGLASVAIVAMVGMLAFVIDAGNFFVIRRELQNIADQAALAGAETFDPTTGASAILPAQGCNPPPPPLTPPTAPPSTLAAQVVCNYVQYNQRVARSLCGTDVVIDEERADGYRLEGPAHGTSPRLFVRVRCEAGYSFGRILNLSSRTMSAQATAVLGSWDGAQIVTYQPFPPFPPTARLIPY